MKRLGSVVILFALLLAGCGRGRSFDDGAGLSFDVAQDIRVVHREEGSGTREAFVDLFGVRSKASAQEVAQDRSAQGLVAATDGEMLAAVAGDKYAIGYVSVGSLGTGVKPLRIDGYEPTPENVKAGSYKMSCPLLLVTRGKPMGTASDFIRYVQSPQGQKVVAQSHVPADAAQEYQPYGASGKVVIHGSGTMADLMERLAAAYREQNPAVTFEIVPSDSAAGLDSLWSGGCHMAMVSRELTGDEVGTLRAARIGTDGICVIVHPDSNFAGLTADQVKRIFTGTCKSWDKVGKS